MNGMRDLKETTISGSGSQFFTDKLADDFSRGLVAVQRNRFNRFGSFAGQPLPLLNARLLLAGSHVLTDKAGDQLRRGLVGGFRLGLNVPNSHFVQEDYPLAVFGKETVVARLAPVNRRDGPGVLFVQGVRFFVSHCCHLFLLLLHYRKGRLAAQHSVEHVDRVQVDTIIHHFNQIAMGIKTYQKVLVHLAFHNPFIDVGLKGPVDVIHGKPVLKGSRIEADAIVFHSESIGEKAA
jgi:hypothetical protein